MPKNSTKKVMGKEKLWRCLEKEGAGGEMGNIWDELKKEHKVSNIRTSEKKGNVTYLFKARDILGFECSQKVSKCTNRENISYDNLEELSRCMNCSCPKGITMAIRMEQKTDEHTENTDEESTSATKAEDNTIISFISIGVGAVVVCLLIVIVLRIKNKKEKKTKRGKSVDLNPEYGVYYDSECITEIVNDNEYHAAADVYEQDTTEVMDNNIYYE